MSSNYTTGRTLFKGLGITALMAPFMLAQSKGWINLEPSTDRPAVTTESTVVKPAETLILQAK